MINKERPAEENNDEICGTCGCGEEKGRPKEDEQEEQLHKLIRELAKKKKEEKENYKRKKPR